MDPFFDKNCHDNGVELESEDEHQVDVYDLFGSVSVGICRRERKIKNLLS